ncbi:SepM family pheromone-processing serine protease [Longirhabdus pacifica]|uniref:SepM family pheromone-processing serine protease n=1 Tax=Longirhabdus pacifica TaxID=2305227 RepID=UPI001008A7E4|nr:SepM family pheromone-processing serine protease [Longirhabdus pacifica]
MRSWNQNRMQKRWIIFAFIFILLWFIETPYAVSQPGSAQEVQSMIEVKDGFTEEEGSLMLTTVASSRSVNVFYLIYAGVHPNMDIYEKTNESDENYIQRQLTLMRSSHQNAIAAAYDMANIPYALLEQSVRVNSIVPGYPADGKLQGGDDITQIDDVNMTNVDELISYINTKSVGDAVEVYFLRNNESQSVTLTLASSQDGESRPLMGVQLVDVQEIKPDSPDHEVMFDVEKIGGPSAGLIFSLEIYNQLVEEDITKGYEIAGTGTISDSGAVGAIGGIKHKIVAAHEEGAQIFLCPPSNYEEALEKWNDLETDMQLVPVKSLQEAIDFLQNLS